MWACTKRAAAVFAVTGSRRAARLRRETTLSIKAIAARIRLGSSKSANARLHQAMKTLAASSQTNTET